VQAPECSGKCLGEQKWPSVPPVRVIARVSFRSGPHLRILGWCFMNRPGVPENGCALTYGLGVDLGTTFTAAAVRVGGRVEVVRLGGRRAEIPSVLFVGADGPVVIGDAAERRGAARLSRPGWPASSSAAWMIRCRRWWVAPRTPRTQVGLVAAVLRPGGRLGPPPRFPRGCDSN
jgi:hypothetical protein